jgi:hypothetical protein
MGALVAGTARIAAVAALLAAGAQGVLAQQTESSPRFLVGVTAAVAVASPTEIYDVFESDNSLSTGFGIQGAVALDSFLPFPISVQGRWSRHDFKAEFDPLELVGTTDVLAGSVAYRRALSEDGRFVADAGLGVLRMKTEASIANTGAIIGLPGVSGTIRRTESAPLLSFGVSGLVTRIGELSLIGRVGGEVAFAEAGPTVLLPIAIQIGR